jgi:hypothetical protein
MTLTTATVLPGLLLIALGALFLTGNSAVVSMFKSLPRSRVAAVVFFGGGAIWFLYVLAGLPEADLILAKSPRPLMVGFGALALLAFYYLPDFLAVRGLAIVTLLGAWPLLMAAYGEYDLPQRLFMVTIVYLAVALALYVGAVPYRLRDFFHWLFSRPQRAKALGGALLGYGLLLVATAFTY